MRLANVDPATAQAQLTAAIAAPGGLFASNADNAQIVWPGHGLTHEYASLRAECFAAGHGLAEKSKEDDRWIAATARFVDVPLVSHDGVFVDAPGIELLTIEPPQ